MVQALIERIKVRAVGQEVLKSLTPGQALIKVVRDELTAVMGSTAADLNLNVPAPAVILMAGLQGAGKTTTVAKLAKHLKEKRKKKVMVVSADVYRPAAIEQLKTLAQQVDDRVLALDRLGRRRLLLRLGPLDHAGPRPPRERGHVVTLGLQLLDKRTAHVPRGAGDRDLHEPAS